MGGIYIQKSLKSSGNYTQTQTIKPKKDKTFIEWKKYPDKQELKKFLNNYIQRKGKFIHNPQLI